MRKECIDIMNNEYISKYTSRGMPALVRSLFESWSFSIFIFRKFLQ